jgi:hypothetical protein
MLIFFDVSISTPRMKPVASFLAGLVAALFLAGCASQIPPATPAAPVGLDTRPEGPAIAPVKATGDGATVAPATGQDRFALAFRAGPGNPAARLTFADTDINDRLGLALDVRNPDREPVRVYADLNGDTWVRGYVAVAPGQTGTLYVFARRKKHAAAVLTQFPGMHGVPGGKMSLWAGIEEPILAKELKVFVVAPSAATRIEVGNLRPFGSSALPPAAGFFPFIERYGQYKHKDWPGKVLADADFTANRQREDAELAAQPGPAGLDRYGGWAAGPQLEATGHFRVENYQIGFLDIGDTPYAETVAAAREVGYRLYETRRAP